MVCQDFFFTAFLNEHILTFLIKWGDSLPVFQIYCRDKIQNPYKFFASEIEIGRGVNKQNICG